MAGRGPAREGLRIDHVLRLESDTGTATVSRDQPLHLASVITTIMLTSGYLPVGPLPVRDSDLPQAGETDYAILASGSADSQRGCRTDVSVR